MSYVNRFAAIAVFEKHHNRLMMKQLLRTGNRLLMVEQVPGVQQASFYVSNTYCSTIMIQLSPLLVDNSVRSFHGTAITNFAVSRRRRGDRSSIVTPVTSNVSSAKDAEETTINDEDDNVSTPRLTVARNPIVTDPKEFEIAVQKQIDKLVKALLPLEALNDPFVLTVDDGDDDELGPSILLDLGPVHGQYTIQFDTEQCILVFISPISGQIAYNLSSTGEWCSDEDGHNFEGLLVRDLIRQVIGVPQL